jgi:hypothetical protein
MAMLSALPVWVALGFWFGADLRAPSNWIAWTSLILVQPLLEEVVFRGLLLSQVARLISTKTVLIWTLHISVANIVVTVCFAADHLRTQPPQWALAIVIPSLVLGHLRERTGSVWPPVLVHILYNTGFGLAAWVGNYTT